MPFVDGESLSTALERLHGTADHMLKVWLTLKQAGMAEGKPVSVTTTAPVIVGALQRLFAYGEPSGRLFVPFAHTKRFKTIKHDASRSIIQTTVRRWLSSQSVVGVDPTAFIDIEEESGTLLVQPGRHYPLGLGQGQNGFALDDDSRVSIPDIAFAVWYYRQTDLLPSELSRRSLCERLAADLNLTPSEMDLIFIQDEDWTPTLQSQPLSDNELHRLVEASIDGSSGNSEVIVAQTFDDHLARVRSMVTVRPGPSWLNKSPQDRLLELIGNDAKAILLYGPPRTSKTHAIDQLVPRSNSERETIQIHNGWGYDDLMVGLKPVGDRWDYVVGPLLQAIRQGKKTIVLEEINRTEFSDAIGELFLLLEDAYRGEEHKVRLRSGEDFYVPEDVTFLFTMNTLDRSTEAIDDALFGRMDAIEFPPRIEDLHELLKAKGITEEISVKVRELFATILEHYQLGHGYFAGYSSTTNPIDFYLNRIRPVLQKHLVNHRDEELETIDEKVNQLFGP